MVDVYDFILKRNITGTYNVGFENLTVKRLPKKFVKEKKL